MRNPTKEGYNQGKEEGLEGKKTEIQRKMEVGRKKKTKTQRIKEKLER